MKTYTEQEVRAIVLAFASLLPDEIQNHSTLQSANDYLDKVFNSENVTPSDPVQSTLTELDHYEAAKRWSNAAYGIVIFYEPNYENGTIKGIGRTAAKNVADAFDIYANTPNPASQMLKFSTEEELQAEIEYHKKCINDREWLDELFNQI